MTFCSKIAKKCSKLHLKNKFCRAIDQYEPAVRDLLRPILIDNQSIRMTTWGAGVVNEPMDFEFNAPVCLDTKVYPVKRELRDLFFSTLQYMCLHKIHKKGKKRRKKRGKRGE